MRSEEATSHTSFSTSSGLGKLIVSLPFGHMVLTSSHKAATTVSQSGCNFTDGKCSLMSVQTASVASFSMSSEEATSHTSFSTSSGLGKLIVSLPFGHMALTSSHKAATAVSQSGWNFTDGKYSLMSAQTSSVASFSMSSEEATLHTSFSISSGLGKLIVSLPFGHMALTSSHKAATAVSQ